MNYGDKDRVKVALEFKNKARYTEPATLIVVDSPENVIDHLKEELSFLTFTDLDSELQLKNNRVYIRP